MSRDLLLLLLVLPGLLGRWLRSSWSVATTSALSSCLPWLGSGNWLGSDGAGIYLAQWDLENSYTQHTNSPAAESPVIVTQIVMRTKLTVNKLWLPNQTQQKTNNEKYQHLKSPFSWSAQVSGQSWKTLLDVWLDLHLRCQLWCWLIWRAGGG